MKAGKPRASVTVTTILFVQVADIIEKFLNAQKIHMSFFWFLGAGVKKYKEQLFNVQL